MQSSLSVVKKGRTALQKRIDEKIDALRRVENDTPAVIIVHDLRNTSVLYMSLRGQKILGITLDELVAIGPDYHARFFNMEDAKDYVPKILGLLERNNDDEVISFFQQVRHAENNEWRWYLSCTKIFLRDDTGLPLLTITNAAPVDAQHHIAVKAQRLLDENNFLRANYHLFDMLTKREKEVLTQMASGLSSAQMAKKFNMSEMTASTHRRNIKRKLNAESVYDITRFAQAFNLI